MHVEDTPALLEELRRGEHSGVVTATGEGAEGAEGAEAGAEEGAVDGEGEKGAEGAEGAEAGAGAGAETGAEEGGASSSSSRSDNYYTLMQRQARHE